MSRAPSSAGVVESMRPGTPIGEPIYLDEELVAALAPTPAPPSGGAWRLERGHWWGARGGTLVVAGPGDGAPTLSIDHSVRGRYAVYVGLYGAGNRQIFGGVLYGAYVRLSDESHFTHLQVERWEPSYQECYLTTADLDGRRIEFGNFERHTCIDYVKLVPVRQAPLSPARGRVIGILDFADDSDIAEPPLFEAGSAVRQHADAGYDMLMWKAYAVRCEYHTKIGEQRTYTYSGDEIAQRPVYESNLGVALPSVRRRIWRLGRPELLRS